MVQQQKSKVKDRENREKSRTKNCKSRLWERNGFLMLPHPLTNFEIQKYYHKEHRFHGVYSRDNWPSLE